MTNALHLEEVSEKMKDIDIAILSTHAQGGHIANRPMSNNGDVKYDGTSYFFSYARTLHRSDRAECEGSVGLLHRRRHLVFGHLHCRGGTSPADPRQGRIQTRHWTPDLDRWFEKGVDTPDLVLISVRAERIKLWERNDERELVL